MSRLGFIAALALGCNATPPLSRPTPQPPSPSLVAVAVDAAAPLDAAPPDAAPLGPEPLAGGCRGPATLESGGFGGNGPCESTHAPMAVPPGVTFSIEPATVVVRSDDETKAQLVIANTTAGDLELFLDDFDDKMTRIHYEIDDAAGKRVDLVGTACGMITALIARSIHIVLPGGARTSVPFDVDARVSRYGASCELSYAKPLARGHYRLVVTTPSGSVRASLVVR